MKSSLLLRTRSTSKASVRPQRGYILLALLLVVTALSIAALAIYPDVVKQVKRDREEELIHRGVQYSRAVRKFYKKFNRYPNSVEDLLNTNNLRFLRQKYKDPITGKEFKLLHFQDVQLSFPQGGAGGLGGPQGSGPIAPGARPGAGPISFSPPGVQQPQGQRENQPPTDAPPGGEDSGAGGQDAAPGQSQASPPGSGNARADDGSGGAGGAGDSGSSGSQGNSAFGGGPVVGVVSLSKGVTIREFNKKNHYNEWQFIYDPSRDRGGLLNAPVVGGPQSGALGGPGAPGGSTPAGNQGGNGGAPSAGSGSPPPSENK